MRNYEFIESFETFHYFLNANTDMLQAFLSLDNNKRKKERIDY